MNIFKRLNLWNCHTCYFINYIYKAWLHVDTNGYLAQRVDKATGLVITESIGAGAIPADLTILTYS